MYRREDGTAARSTKPTRSLPIPQPTLPLDMRDAFFSLDMPEGEVTCLSLLCMVLEVTQKGETDNTVQVKSLSAWLECPSKSLLHR